MVLALLLAAVGACLAPASAAQQGAVAAVMQAKAKSNLPPADRPDQAMTFVIMRFSSPACEPFCQEWIVAEDVRPLVTRAIPPAAGKAAPPKRPMLLQSPRRRR
jgi:hypothetical protein